LPDRRQMLHWFYWQEGSTSYYSSVECPSVGKLALYETRIPFPFSTSFSVRSDCRNLEMLVPRITYSVFGPHGDKLHFSWFICAFSVSVYLVLAVDCGRVLPDRITDHSLLLSGQPPSWSAWHPQPLRHHELPPTFWNFKITFASQEYKICSKVCN
jgi:hypothetical protein